MCFLKSLKSNTYYWGFFWFYTQKHLRTVFPLSWQEVENGVYVVIIWVGCLLHKKKTKNQLLTGQFPLPYSILLIIKAAAPDQWCWTHVHHQNKGLIQLLMPGPLYRVRQQKRGCRLELPPGDREMWTSWSPSPHTVSGRGGAQYMFPEWIKSRISSINFFVPVFPAQVESHGRARSWAAQTQADPVIDGQHQEDCESPGKLGWAVWCMLHPGRPPGF